MSYQQTGAAKVIGDRLARKLFEQRGNHSEMHVSEDELAFMLSGAADIAFESAGIMPARLGGIVTEPGVA